MSRYIEEMKTLKETYDGLIKKILQNCVNHYGDRLVSLCIFGSVGRGTMKYDSDIDVLIVAVSLVDGRIDRVREFVKNVEAKVDDDIKHARKQNIYIEISPVIMTSSEVQKGSPLFLDMLEDGKILFDKDNFLSNWFDAFRNRLEKLGARRIKKGETWYWILKEPYTFGEKFEI